MFHSTAVETAAIITRMHSSFLLSLLTSIHPASHYPFHSACWPVGDVASTGAGGVPLPATRVAPRTSGGQEHGLLPPDMMISFMGCSDIYTSTPIAGAPEVPRHFTHSSLEKNVCQHDDIVTWKYFIHSGHLWEESTGHQCFNIFFVVSLNKLLKKEQAAKVIPDATFNWIAFYNCIL